ncbi:MAG TPA: amidohydrolase family protein [Candidatus Elarobacter sp.]
MDLVIAGARIFDGSVGTLAFGDVLVRDGRIEAVSGRALAVDGALRIDAGNRVLMPGLIDAHVHAYATHANLKALERIPRSLLALQAKPLLEAMLRRGFTTVRDAGGADAGLARAVDDGLIDGPRIFFSGRALTQTGGHGDTRPADEPCACDSGVLAQVVDGADAVRATAREELRRGAHQIKIFVSGGVASPTDPIWMRQFSDAEVVAAVDEAASRRSYVMAHAYTAESISRAVALGVRSIEHGNLIDAEAAREVAARGAFVDPTLATYEALALHGGDGLSSAMRAKLAQVEGAGISAVALCHDAGVQLGFGTDLLGTMQQYQSREFALRARAQVPLDVLRSATSINARLLQADGEIGTIAAGARADMLLVDGNPLEDLSLLERPDESLVLIVHGGRIVKNALAA